MYNPDDRPTTPEEFTLLIDHYFQKDVARHNAEAAQARAQAEAAWQTQAAAVREELQAKAAPDTPQADIDTQLEQLRQDAIAQTVSMVTPAKTRAEWEEHFSCFRPQEPTQEPEPAAQTDPAHTVYQLADGRLYDAECGEILKNRSVPDARIIQLPIGTEQDLRETLECYHLPLPAFLCTTEELFVRLRLARDSRIAATDYLLTPDYPLTEQKREAVTAYRTALRDLPAQIGAPWDGGGNGTPWPVFE